VRKEILRELQNEYARQREEDDRIFFEHQEKAIAECPEIGRLIDERQNLIFSALRGMVRGEKAELVPESMERIQKAISSRLKENGFPENYLEPVYRCPICKDTGYVGEPIREMCTCMQRELNRRLYSQVELGNTEEQSFETFDLMRFPDTQIPDLGCSQRQMMDVLRRLTREWSENWPDVPHPGGVLFSGASGLGKTFLMHAMARVLLQRGFNVLILSAYRAQEIMRQAYMKGEDESLSMLMDADILCLDDLGSEPLMQNITITQLFNLLNERLIRGKGFIISTNLSPRDLRDKYTERITSRLLDKTRVEVFEMRGQDIRRM